MTPAGLRLLQDLRRQLLDPPTGCVQTNRQPAQRKATKLSELSPSCITNRNPWPAIYTDPETLPTLPRQGAGPTDC
jgi:hypothetical protein